MPSYGGGPQRPSRYMGSGPARSNRPDVRSFSGGQPWQPTSSSQGGSDPFSQSTTTADPNPQLQALMGDWNSYQNQLATNTDLEATNAIRRMTALTDRRTKMAGSGALQRLGPGSGVQEKIMARAQAAGMSDMSAANSQLAEGGRRAQLGALQGKTALAGGMAQDMRAAADQAMRQAQIRMDYDRWEAERADRINQQGFQNNYQLLQFATQPQFWRG